MLGCRISPRQDFTGSSETSAVSISCNAPGTPGICRTGPPGGVPACADVATGMCVADNPNSNAGHCEYQKVASNTCLCIEGEIRQCPAMDQEGRFQYCVSRNALATEWQVDAGGPICGPKLVACHIDQPDCPGQQEATYNASQHMWIADPNKPCIPSPSCRATYRLCTGETESKSAFHQIVNQAYNQCLDAPKGTINVHLQLANCTTSTTQQWAFVAASTLDTYYLVNRENGLCAEVNNNTNKPTEWIDLWNCDGSSAEQWVKHCRDGGVKGAKYMHNGTALCLDTISGPGSGLMQWDCDSHGDVQTNDEAQTWLVR